MSFEYIIERENTAKNLSKEEEKELVQKITVAVAFELETGNTKNPDIKVNMDTIE
jgi:hypothetical protein